ncbi:MAG: hypothetical protein ACRD0W_24455 [Acidimicrobiales bacterium]
MGLDTTHDAWGGGYIAFTRWRNKLAEVAGYYVEPQHIRSFSDGSPDESVSANVCLDWGHVTEAQIMGKWTAMPCNILGEPDPLLILLAHSDCDGMIEAQYCAPLADRIEQLIPRLPTESAAGHIGDWRAKTQRFVDGLRQAAAAGEDVGFH